MEQPIQYTHTARYFTHGNPDAPNLLIALHGYGQLASYFIKKFEFLNQERYFVVVPEGLHRFYINGTSGRVGASWMTKENREVDIKNYLIYLNTILSTIDFEKYNCKVLLGFSQGGATASRLIADTSYHFDKYILWAAVFPPDLENANFSKFNSSKNYFVVGSIDEYYSSKDIVNEKERFAKLNLSMKFVEFEGNHQIDIATLDEILNEN